MEYPMSEPKYEHINEILSSSTKTLLDQPRSQSRLASYTTQQPTGYRKTNQEGTQGRGEENSSPAELSTSNS